MDDIEAYIEMLYEDEDRLIAISHFKEKSCTYENLQQLLQNEVLMRALVRLFREESKKNFELAIHTATIFRNASKFTNFNYILSYYKIGGSTMQLVDYELKRCEMWQTQVITSKVLSKKLEYAMQKQNKLLSVCMEILMNLADNIEIEYKMVKRGLLHMLDKCLTHTTSNVLVSVVCEFLCKLSAVKDNHTLMHSLGIIDKCTKMICNDFLFNNVDTTLALLFNLSFDRSSCKPMVDSVFVNKLVALINDKNIALNLLYQLSITDNAKAIIAFTDVIPKLKTMLFECNYPSRLIVVKAILVNISMERRNAQIIASQDDIGFNEIIRYALENQDILSLKIIRNIVIYDSTAHTMILEWMPQLLEYAFLNIECPSNDEKAFLLKYECLRIICNVTTADWTKLNLDYILVQRIIDSTRSIENIDDDILLQTIILMGTICASSNLGNKFLVQSKQLLDLIDAKFDDTEFISTILYFFACLILDDELASHLCNNDSLIAQCFVRFMNDSDLKIRHLCNNVLAKILDVNKGWLINISNEQFCRYNKFWLEMIETTTESSATSCSVNHLNEQLKNVILDANEILENI